MEYRVKSQKKGKLIAMVIVLLAIVFLPVLSLFVGIAFIGMLVAIPFGTVYVVKNGTKTNYKIRFR